MKKLFAAIIVTGLVLMIASCGTSTEKMSAKITKLEQEMKVQSPADTVKVDELLDAYEAFVTKYPKDSLAPEYLFREGGLALSFNKADKAIALFRKAEKEYPSYKRAGECLFMQGFIYENAKGDVAKAGAVYKDFLAKYPGHSLADDAELSLKSLGNPAEEIIRDITRQSADTVAVLPGN
jgi:tetratricopeptide (TPR) repeat protein